MDSFRRALAFLTIALVAWSSTAMSARADDIKVMNSGGFSAAYKALQPKFEAGSGHTLTTAWGPSMGASPDAIPNRLARGEVADVLIMVGYALDELIAKGIVRADSKVDLADSRIGMVVKAGAVKPEISTVEGLKAVFLHARSIGYSDSASGLYVERELFKKLGIEDQVKPKIRKVQQTPVAMLVASGELEIGLQQVSELLPIAGADFVGRLPEAVQSVTTFAAGIPVAATHPEAARTLIQFLASASARPDVVRAGLDPRP